MPQRHVAAAGHHGHGHGHHEGHDPDDPHGKGHGKGHEKGHGKGHDPHDPHAHAHKEHTTGSGGSREHTTGSGGQPVSHGMPASGVDGSKPMLKRTGAPMDAPGHDDMARQHPGLDVEARDSGQPSEVRKFPPPRSAPRDFDARTADRAGQELSRKVLGPKTSDDRSRDLAPELAVASSQPFRSELVPAETPGRAGGGVLLDADMGNEPHSPSGAMDKKSFMEKLKAQSAQRTVNPLHGENKIASRISTHPFFEPVCLVIICMNAMWIGYSTDQEDPDGADPPYYHGMAENFFCLFFSAEIILRIAAYRKPMSFVFDKPNRAWNLFDATLVVILLGETWAMPMMMKGSEPDVPALSSMRLLRMLRMVRVLKMVPELAMMVRSLVAAIRSTSMTLILAVGIMYIFSIVLTQWARSYKQIGPCVPAPPSMPEACVEAAFGSIAKSFLTLMQIICFDASFALIRAVLNERIPYGLLLLLFILIAAFTVLNMLIGVVCQIVANTSANERNTSRKQQVVALFRLLEIEDTGFISRKELERNVHVLEELDKLGVDDEVLKTSLSIIDRKNASVSDDPSHIDLEEFLEVVFKLLHPPQTQDILLVQSKLEKLEKALASTGMSQAKDAEAAIKAKTDQLDDDAYEMDEGTRMAVENSLWELETQVTSMMNHALETTGTGKGKKAPFLGAGWDVELRRLDAAMCRLRVRLERCQDEATPSSAGGGGAADEAVQMATEELKYWRRLCGEVVQSISAASALMAQALRESQPDGMFRGVVDFPSAGDRSSGKWEM